MPNNGKITVNKKIWQSVYTTTLQHMYGNGGTTGQKTLVGTCAKVSRNKSRMQGKYVVQSTSTNWQNYPQQQTRHHTRDNEKGTCMLIDVAISGDRNGIKIEAEKILKYKEITIEIQRMWNVKQRW